MENEDAIQCDLCCMWVHAVCDNVSKEQYNAIQVLSSINNCVYCCNVKSITNDWIKHQAGLSQPDFLTSTLAQDLEQLTSAHNSTEKAVSYLVNKIEMLQLLETDYLTKFKRLQMHWRDTQLTLLTKHMIVN